MFDFADVEEMALEAAPAVTTAEQIPHGTSFDLAREQLVRKSGHVGILFEGDLDGGHVKRALWGSMAGNNRLLNGNESAIFDSIVDDTMVVARTSSGPMPPWRSRWSARSSTFGIGNSVTTVRSTSSTTRLPDGSMTVSPSATSTGSPGCAVPVRVASTASASSPIDRRCRR